MRVSTTCVWGVTPLCGADTRSGVGVWLLHTHTFRISAYTHKRTTPPCFTNKTQNSQGEFKLLRVPDWAWSEVREPRVVPLVTNALYYTLLLVS